MMRPTFAEDCAGYGALALLALVAWLALVVLP